MKFVTRIATLTLAVALLPTLASANPQYIAAGTKALQAKQYDKAIQYFGAVIKQNPRDAKAAAGLGYAFYAKGNKARALQYYQYAVKLNPADTRSKQMIQRLQGSRGSGRTTNKYYAYGVRYLKARQYPNAIKYLVPAAKQEPNNASVWQSLGNAYYGARQKENAIKAWERALAINPNAALRAYVDKLKGAAPAAAATETAQADLPPGVPDHDNMNYNPWVMGSTVAVLGAVMLFLF